MSYRLEYPTTSSPSLHIVQASEIPMDQTLCMESLTLRETEILGLQGKGLTLKRIARELAISPGTVKWHVQNVYGKLDVSCREEALCRARLHNII